MNLILFLCSLLVLGLILRNLFTSTMQTQCIGRWLYPACALLTSVTFLAHPLYADKARKPTGPTNQSEKQRSGKRRQTAQWKESFGD